MVKPFISRPETGHRYSSNVPLIKGDGTIMWKITLHDTEGAARAAIAKAKEESK